jgi:hypothetical protein
MTTAPEANRGVVLVARLLTGMVLTSCSLAHAQTTKGLKSFDVH